MYFSRIRDLREDADQTQQAVADYLNMQRCVYRRYELGEREIPVWAVIPGWRSIIMCRPTICSG